MSVAVSGCRPESAALAGVSGEGVGAGGAAGGGVTAAGAGVGAAAGVAGVNEGVNPLAAGLKLKLDAAGLKLNVFGCDAAAGAAGAASCISSSQFSFVSAITRSFRATTEASRFSQVLINTATQSRAYPAAQRGLSAPQHGQQRRGGRKREGLTVQVGAADDGHVAMIEGGLKNLMLSDVMSTRWRRGVIRAAGGLSETSPSRAIKGPPPCRGRMGSRGKPRRSLTASASFAVLTLCTVTQAAVLSCIGSGDFLSTTDSSGTLSFEPLAPATGVNCSFLIRGNGVALHSLFLDFDSSACSLALRQTSQLNLMKHVPCLNLTHTAGRSQVPSILKYSVSEPTY